MKHGRKVAQEALVHCIGTSVDDATWEAFDELQRRFPQMNLEDKIRLQGDKNVMIQTKGGDKHASNKEWADKELMDIWLSFQMLFQVVD